ncbi:MAG: HTH domain-containing protein, partial [Ruminococcaceae bacterium]|nr:HTH domain-containing protein [Oscillospiraceae bacterium]
LTPVERRNKLLEIINKNPKTTASDLVQLLHVSISTVERDLAKLTEDGYIEYVGSSKAGEWIVKTNLSGKDTN